MHDITEYDRRGLPGCVVLTEAFERAAGRQAEALGFSPALQLVPHPIQNRTADELEEIADRVVPAVLAAIGQDPTVHQ